MRLHITLRKILQERAMTQAELARMTHLRSSTISGLCKDNRMSVNKSHLGKIATVLQIKDVSKLLVLK